MVASGFWQGLAILTHISAGFYTLGIFLDDVFSHSSRPHRRFQVILLVGISIGVVVLPWFLWVVGHYGLPILWQSSPAIVGNSGVFSGGWWRDRVINLTGTLFPLPVFDALRQQLWEPGYWWDTWLRFYYYVLPGTCTITVSLILWKYLRQKSGSELFLKATST